MDTALMRSLYEEKALLVKGDGGRSVLKGKLFYRLPYFQNRLFQHDSNIHVTMGTVLVVTLSPLLIKKVTARTVPIVTKNRPC